MKRIITAFVVLLLVSPVSAQSSWNYERGTKPLRLHSLSTNWHEAYCGGRPVTVKFEFSCSEYSSEAPTFKSLSPHSHEAILVVGGWPSICPLLSTNVKDALADSRGTIQEKVSVFIELGATSRWGWTLDGTVHGVHGYGSTVDSMALFIYFDPQVLYRSLVDARSAGIDGGIENSASGLIPRTRVFVPEIDVANLRKAASRFERDCDYSFE